MISMRKLSLCTVMAKYTDDKLILFFLLFLQKIAIDISRKASLCRKMSNRIFLEK